MNRAARSLRAVFATLFGLVLLVTATLVMMPAPADAREQSSNWSYGLELRSTEVGILHYRYNTTGSSGRPTWDTFRLPGFLLGYSKPLKVGETSGFYWGTSLGIYPIGAYSGEDWAGDKASGLAAPALGLDLYAEPYYDFGDRTTLYARVGLDFLVAYGHGDEGTEAAWYDEAFETGSLGVLTAVGLEYPMNEKWIADFTLRLTFLPIVGWDGKSDVDPEIDSLTTLGLAVSLSRR